MSDDLDAIVEQTAEMVGALVQKPRMSAKHLRKPPFRFLHDTIFALGGSYGFPSLDIFDEDEMVGKKIKDRDAKIAFLDKLIAHVEQVTGQQVAMRPGKVVAGLEPELTNEFLQLLAQYAGGGGDGGDSGGKEADDGGAAEEEAQRAAEAEAAARAEEDRRRADAEDRERAERAQRQREQEQAEAEARARAEAEAASKAADAGGKFAEDDEGDGKDAGGGDSELDGPVRVDGTIGTTQRLLGQLITKPKLSQKLLSKPPYRFLHDIVTRLEGATGFGAGLLQGDELNAKCKDRDVKLSMLDKVINVVGLVHGVVIDANPAKIVAGLEPEKTNEMLQYLAYAAVRGGSAEAVSRVLNGERMEDGASGGDAGGPEEPAGRDADADRHREREQQREEADRARREREAEAEAQAQRERERERAQRAARAAEEEQRAAQMAAAQAQAAAGGAGDDGGDGGMGGMGGGPPVKRLSRPMTARRRPPRVRESQQQVDQVPDAKKMGNAVGIMKEGEDSDSDDEPVVEEKVEDDAFGAAGQGAGGAGKLTRDILDQQRKAEEQKPEQKEESKGTGIRLGRIKKAGDKGGRSRVDVTKLRTYIQKLCQSTNPLGKCMDYVMEDMESMKNELSAWQAEYQRRSMALESEQEITREELEPLELELKQVDQRIEEQVQKINGVKAKIARNDARIQELLRMLVSW